MKQNKVNHEGKISQEEKVELPGRNFSLVFSCGEHKKTSNFKLA
jgi:hypothetical protein